MLTFAKTFRTAVQLYKLCKIKMKNTYKANFLANNGTRFEKPIEDSNLERIIKSVRYTAEGERFDKNTCSWSVWVDDESTTEGYRMVAAGGMDVNGVRYRVRGNDLKWL